MFTSGAYVRIADSHPVRSFLSTPLGVFRTVTEYPEFVPAGPDSWFIEVLFMGVPHILEVTPDDRHHLTVVSPGPNAM